MNSKPIQFLVVICALALQSNAQISHQAWLDSIQSDSYIGMEVWLDDLELSEARHIDESAAYGFYKNNPLNSTEEVLSRLPGMSMIRRGNYAWEPTINGLSSGQVNVAIDGMRMFGACTDKMDPVSSYVEPNNLESIVIEKGGAGSAHGSTVGGAVDFKLKRPRFNQAWSGSLNSRYETVSNGMSQSASLSYGTEKLAIRMNGSYRNYQDYTDGEGDEVYHSGYKKLNYSLSGAYRLKGNNLINFDFLIDDARDIGYPGLPMDVAFAKAKIGAVSYTMFEPLNWLTEVEFKAYANTVDHLMDDSKRMDIPVRMDMPGETKTYGGYAQASAVRGNHIIQAKLDGYATNAYAEMTMFIPNERDMFMLTWPDVDRKDVGLFVSDQWQTTEKLTTEISMRGEQAFTQMNSEMGKGQFAVFGYGEEDFQVNHFVLNTGVSLNYSWSSAFSTKIGGSYGERLPSVSEMYGFYLYNNFDGYDYIGNPEIKKESSYQLTGSINYQPVEKLEINVSGFHYWFNDYIIGYVDESLDAMTIGAKGVKVYENVDGVTFSGFDAQVLYQASKHLQLLYAVKATYATDGEGTPLPLIPPLKNNLTVVGQIKGFKLQADGEWSMAQNQISENTGEIATPAYQLIHLRASKDWDMEKVKLGLSLGVENVLDESYREHLDWGGVLRPGRNFYASLKVGF
ncbi:MAG: TonB-dependent receptor plug domain-containing protein [Reichenbachiella sp.]|uniref:TonB-dependent receptor n=1 Tax=Reichenbachiella sp. TaxID=2184521 RepID=UPI002966FB63|nr:TonB-dependent receptor [Reichenbachiella sp.]MDW3209247.1 TonB-dependent receptor plug domain-containing protein [Reichenbachiella sp.]